MHVAARSRPKAEELTLTYFVYIESRSASVPHMEPLDADCATSATVEALKRLRTHANGIAAHVYQGDTRVASVSREDMER